MTKNGHSATNTLDKNLVRVLHNIANLTVAVITKNVAFFSLSYSDLVTFM